MVGSTQPCARAGLHRLKFAAITKRVAAAIRADRIFENRNTIGLFS
jgi:hypothetical protein